MIIQIDVFPLTIKLTRESLRCTWVFLTAPTFLIGFRDIFPMHIGTQEYSLVSRHFREYYLNWLAAVDANKQSIQRCSQGLQAGLDCWRNGYLQMYLYFDDSFLSENYYWRLPTIGLATGILWYARRTPHTIYAMVKAIIQLCPHSPMAASP